MNKSKLFKLNILKAFHDDEDRQLQKDVLKSIIIDELTEEEAGQMLELQAIKRRREALVELGLPPDTDLTQLAGALPAPTEPEEEETEPETETVGIDDDEEEFEEDAAEEEEVEEEDEDTEDDDAEESEDEDGEDDDSEEEDEEETESNTEG